MKALRIIMIALLVSPALLFTTGCGDDTVTPTPVDTTEDNSPDIFNRFTAGFEQYDLVIEPNSTYGVFNATTGLTTINVVGESTRVVGTPVVDGHAEMEIKVYTDDVGTYRQADQDDVEIEVATGEGIRREEFSWDDNSNMVVSITQYDSVGGIIKGTFSGVLKNGINSVTFKNGEFQVERIEDR